MMPHLLEQDEQYQERLAIARADANQEFLRMFGKMARRWEANALQSQFCLLFALGILFTIGLLLSVWN